MITTRLYFVPALIFAAFLLLAITVAPVTAAPLWELNLKEDPSIPVGKIAMVQGKTSPEGVRFIAKTLEIEQPIQVTLVPDDDSVDLKLLVYKGDWNAPKLEGTTLAEKGEVTFRFRTGDHAAFKVTGPERAGYQMFVWVGPKIKLPPPSPFVGMSVFLKENKAVVLPASAEVSDGSSAPSASTGQSTAEGGDVIVYSLLGALLLVLLVIAGLLVKNKKAKVAVLLFFGFVLSFPIAPHALAQTTEAMKPRSMTPAEAHDRLSKALNKLRDELSKLPASGNGDIDDVVGGAQIMISFLEQFGLIDRREAAVQPNYNPPGLPPLPSRCFEDPTGACGVCFSGANRDLDKWRGLLEDQWVIYKRTMLEAGRIVELADAAAGMSPLVKLKWAVEKNNPNEGFNKSKAKFFASYDKNYDELIKRVNDSLIAIGKCERDHFGDPDWYNRYGLPYYLFMRDRYQRK